MQGGSQLQTNKKVEDIQGVHQVSASVDCMAFPGVGAADLKHLSYEHSITLSAEQTRDFLLEKVQVYRHFATTIFRSGCMLQECPVPVTCTRLQLYRLVVVWIAGVVLRDSEMLVEPRTMFPTDEEVMIAVTCLRYDGIKDVVDEFAKLYTTEYHAQGVFEWCCGYFSRNDIPTALVEALTADSQWQDLVLKLQRSRWHVVGGGSVYCGTHVSGLTVHDSHFHSMYIYFNLKLDDSMCVLTEADKLAVDTLSLFASQSRWVLLSMATSTDLAEWENHMLETEGNVLSVEWPRLLYRGAPSRFMPLHMHGVSNPSFAPGGPYYEYWRAPLAVDTHSYHVPFTAMFCGTAHSILSFSLNTLHFLLCIEDCLEDYLDKELQACRYTGLRPDTSLLYHELQRLHQLNLDDDNLEQHGRWQNMVATILSKSM